MKFIKILLSSIIFVASVTNYSIKTADLKSRTKTAATYELPPQVYYITGIDVLDETISWDIPYLKKALDTVLKDFKQSVYEKKLNLEYSYDTYLLNPIQDIVNSFKDKFKKILKAFTSFSEVQKNQIKERYDALLQKECAAFFKKNKLNDGLFIKHHSLPSVKSQTARGRLTTKLMQRQVAYNLRHCANPNCKKIEDKPSGFQKCSQCKSECYCSKECQKIHWKIHKKNCKPKKEQIPPSSAAAAAESVEQETSEDASESDVGNSQSAEQSEDVAAILPPPEEGTASRIEELD